MTLLTNECRDLRQREGPVQKPVQRQCGAHVNQHVADVVADWGLTSERMIHGEAPRDDDPVRALPRFPRRPHVINERVREENRVIVEKEGAR